MDDLIICFKLETGNLAYIHLIKSPRGKRPGPSYSVYKDNSRNANLRA